MCESEFMNRCPVCFYLLPYPARDYHICPCCGTEFGNDDADQTHSELRQEWLDQGTPWFFGNPPAGWNPLQQLLNAGLNFSLQVLEGDPVVSSIPTVVGNWRIETKSDSVDQVEYAIAG
jgi:hypothetical protein